MKAENIFGRPPVEPEKDEDEILRVVPLEKREGADAEPVSEGEWERRLETIRGFMVTVLEQAVVNVARPAHENRPVSWDWVKAVVPQIARSAVGERRRELDNEMTRPAALAKIDLTVRLAAKAVEAWTTDPADEKKITELRQKGWGMESPFCLLQVALGHFREENLFPSQSTNFLSSRISDDETNKIIAMANATRDVYEKSLAEATRGLKKYYDGREKDYPLVEMNIDELAEARTDYIVRCPIKLAQRFGAIQNIIPEAEGTDDEKIREVSVAALTELRGLIGYRQFIKDYEKALLNRMTDPDPYFPDYRYVWCNPRLWERKVRENYRLSPTVAIPSEEQRWIEGAARNNLYVAHALDGLKEEQGNLASIERILDGPLSRLGKEEKDKAIREFGKKRVAVPTLKAFQRTSEGTPQSDETNWKNHFSKINEKWGKLNVITWQPPLVTGYPSERTIAGRTPERRSGEGGERSEGLETAVEQPRAAKAPAVYEPPRVSRSQNLGEREGGRPGVVSITSKQRRKMRIIRQKQQEVKNLEPSVKRYAKGLGWRVLKFLGFKSHEREKQAQRLAQLRGEIERLRQELKDTAAGEGEAQVADEKTGSPQS